ncbi:hypothetical protein C8F04DRAFT_1270234 [Mycena alexandri]|uniref:Uncharacterized protein n=1 Tax=Mycena alexandri TaxID=1745969 RepID=A0AAD6SBN3_9AGAR|nr:hypothetical protein C8F04DRAFT_1270234 [Mycena alexandri]
MSLLYWYLPGYGQTTSDRAFLDPFIPRVWFNNSIPLLASVELNSVPVMWHVPHSFENLESVDLSDFPSMSPIGWEIFAALFAAALRLRILRIGNIRVASLEVLDVRFVGSSLLGRLLQRMDFPNIQTFVARGFYQVDLDATLMCAHLLSRVTRFVLRGWMGEVEDMWPLFDRLSAIETLDLTHARGEVFRSFHDWTAVRGAGDDGFPVGSVTALFVGHVDTSMLVSYCKLRGVGVVGAMPYVPLRRLRLEAPSFSRAATARTKEELSWLRKNLPSVRLTYCYQECRQVLSTITSHSLHHHFE